MIQLDKNPEVFLKELKNDIENIGWLIPVPDKNIAVFDKKVTEAKHIVTSIKRATQWLSNVSYNSILKNLKEFNSHYKEVVDLDAKIKFNEDKVKSSVSVMEEAAELEKIYDGLEIYYEEPQIKSLVGLDEKIKKAKANYDFLKKIGQFASNISLADLKLEVSNIKLSLLITEVDKKFKTKENLINSLILKKDKLEKGFNQMELLVQEIKTKGKEYLRLNPASDKCPMCQTPHTKRELSERLEDTQNVLSSSGVLADLLNEINTETKELKVQENNRKIIEKIKTLAFSVWGENGYDKNYSTIINYISKIPDLIDESLSAYKDLGEFKEYFLKKNLVEENYRNLQDGLEYWEIEIKNKSDFQKKQKLNKEMIVSITRQNKISKQQIGELKSKRDAVYTICKIDTKNQKLGLETRIQEMEEAKTGFKELARFIKVGGEERISSYEKNIEKLNILFQKYKTLKKQKEEHETRVSAATKNVKDLGKQKETNEILLKRAKDALSALKEIQNKHSKSQALKEFIDNNKKEISEIFTVIHSPKEFDSIQFFDTKKGIALNRIDSKGQCNISEISTGQRAALALAIFSTLNRKLENGPNILLFDDPVANIDDLNILLYFDYLREVAINGKRQIFFATANENVAFLFKQKFEFLGEENFKEFEFSR